MFKASNNVRLFFIMLATLIMVANWLTGFAVVHWFAYFPPAALAFAAVTGLCPGLMMSDKILKMFGKA